MPLTDGPAKVTGSLRFTPDLNMPGLLHARFLTSSHAHANIRSIDKSAALNVPGVVAVLTAEDLPDIVPSSRSRLMLARERVIFAGQPVALIVGTSEAAAEDGLDQVMVDYEPLPASITIDEALAPDAPLVWPRGIPKGRDDASIHGAASGGDETTSHQHTNVVHEFTNTRGDIAQGFAESDVIVEHTYSTPVVHQSYLEPQAVIVQPDPFTGGLTIWASTQGQFPVRDDVAEILGLPPTKVRVIGMPVGGGFGGKIVLYEPLVALAAQKLGRPVKLVLTRMEDLLAGNPAPAARMWLKVGAKKDGTLNALHAKITVDTGCYSSGLGGSIAFLLGSMYRLPHYCIESTEVLTHKVSTSAYRAPGAPSAAYAIDSAMDELAAKLNLDPLDIRLKNAARPGDIRSDDKPWPSMGLIEVLEAIKAHPAWQGREAARAAGRGVGIGVGGWTGGIEPTAAVCMVDKDGTVHVHVGAADLSGSATTFALLTSEVFGVPFEQVKVDIDDTSTAPFTGVTAGSKITYTLGPAVVQAAQEARAQALEIAADQFEADAADLEIVDGMVHVKGVPERAIPLKDIAAKGMQWSSKHSPIIAHGRHATAVQAPGFSAQLAEVEVDKETGFVHVHKLVVVQDVGKAINPLAVEGQMLGGATQGLGWALYEKIAYAEDGQVLSGTLMDYNVPAITQSASVYETVMVEVPAENGPFGAKGVGEPPVIPTAAAVANAIADATGVRLTDLPMTPPQLYAALHGGG
jgi:CO/xanthine dehydrogenase Mo-binding subunit